MIRLAVYLHLIRSFLSMTAFLKAVIPAKANASRVPSSDTAKRSRITCHAFSPGIIQIFEVSIQPDSLFPVYNTTSSIDSALGGPASCCLTETGLTSAIHINFFVWSVWIRSHSFDTSRTIVSPIRTLAEPSALPRIPTSPRHLCLQTVHVHPISDHYLLIL